MRRESINVARVLKTLGKPSISTEFLGGYMETVFPVFTARRLSFRFCADRQYDQNLHHDSRSAQQHPYRIG
jgi:fructose-1-phosphate kinase PfkB-like protein